MIWTIIVALAVWLGVTFSGRAFWGWVLGVATLLVGSAVLGTTGWLWWITAILTAGLAILFGYLPLRQELISEKLIGPVSAALPRIGETERIALEAGTVWFDGELFSGKPDWNVLLDYPLKPLSQEEQDFVDGPTEELCQLLDDFQIAQERDLPEEIWAFIKDHRFFGMIVPKQYGGLEFSHYGHAAVVTKIASRSVTAAVTVMVPNSLGPAELLLHYGTQEQRNHYLPRLASGEDIPCFALTGPEAGSDAAATQSRGVVCKGVYHGEEVLGIRLNWKKRYITLAPIATLVGLAFRLYDPDGLIGEEEDLGITCALIPRDTVGVEIGERHDPMGVPFQNGPTVGHDVFVPIDTIIGGIEGAGNGWRMLMESLAAGRSISLPALSVGAAQLATRVVGAYGSIREQFDTPIGRFEGVEEPLARIGGLTFLMTAARRLTCAALDQGAKPSVISAIVKAYLTDGMREVLIDAMDIRAGAGIMRGPRNVLARGYVAVPIAITVEGANILTRSMIIYGQGAIRSHPKVQPLLESAGSDDVDAFDTALFGYVNFVVSNAARALLLGLSGGRLAAAPSSSFARYYRQLSRTSSQFVLASDFCMAVLGGQLKRREKISGRLADMLAWMYLAASALKAQHEEQNGAWAKDFVEWGCEHALYEAQQALLGIIENLPLRPAAWLLKVLAFPLGPRLKPPSDRLGARVARSLLEDQAARENLTRDIFVPNEDEVGLGRMEAALDNTVEGRRVERKLRDAVRAGEIDKAPGLQLARIGLEAGVITRTDFEILERAEETATEVVRVDAFEPDTYRNLK